MTLGGSGVGSSPGGPQQLSYSELEKTATAAMARAAMGIVKDSLTIPLLTVDDATRKYQSSSNRPVLAPLSTTRGAATHLAPSDDEWKLVHQELKELLPKDFRSLFESAMQLPEDQRNRNITLLDGNLQLGAKILTILRNAALPLDPESLAAIRAGDNIARPYIALNALVFISQQLLDGAHAYLEMVGANNPNFDYISGTLAAFSMISEDLTAAIKLMSATATEKEGLELLATVHEQISTLKAQFDLIGARGEFLLLGNTLHAIELATAALLLESPGSSALLIGLSNALYQLEKGGLGITGNSFAAVSNAVADGLKTIYLKDSDAGKQLLFHTLLQTAILSTVLLGSLMYDSTVQKRSQKEETPELNSEKNFSHSLTINFLTNSGTLSQIGSLIAQESGASETHQASMTSVIAATLTLLLIAPSLRGGDMQTTGQLLDHVSDLLDNPLTQGANALNGNSGANALSPEFKVHLQQAQIALEQRDTDALQEAIKNLQELTHTSNDEFIRDFQDLKKTAHTTATHIETSSSSAATTGITQAA